MVNGCSFFLWKLIQIVELLRPEIAAAFSKIGFGFHFGFLTRRVDWNGERWLRTFTVHSMVKMIIKFIKNYKNKIITKSRQVPSLILKQVFR